MKHSLPAGILVPLVTPFGPDGELDLAAFEANAASLLDAGCAGVLVCGSNGEAGALAEEEKLALVRSARRLSGTVLVGTGLESTRGTIALTHKAADLGADAALVLTPHFYKGRMTSGALRRHFETVAAASPIPVLVYSVPAFTGLPVPPELALELAAHPRIAGMKDSSGDIAALARIAAGAGEEFWLASGSAPTLYPALAVGARAAILAVANCAPEAPLALHAAFRRGDHAEALRLQRLFQPLAEAVTRRYGVAGLKAAMDLAGRQGGHVRAPLEPVDAAARRELAELLARVRDAVPA